MVKGQWSIVICHWSIVILPIPLVSRVPRVPRVLLLSNQPGERSQILYLNLVQNYKSAYRRVFRQ